MTITQQRTNWPSRRIVHEGVTPDADTGAILTPIYQSTTYIQGAPPPAQRPSARPTYYSTQLTRVELTLTFRVRRQ